MLKQKPDIISVVNALISNKVSSQLFLGTGIVVFGLLTSTPSLAVRITSVIAPDLIRYKDGVNYPFTIQVSGEYAGTDEETILSVEYWDKDISTPDDPIDKVNGKNSIRIPQPPGNPDNAPPWGPINVTLYVGCTVGGEVFGPSSVGDSTGEDPMENGYFKFTGQEFKSQSWGYNKVACENPPPPPPPPDNDEPVIPPTPTPPYPDMTPIPEPLTILGTMTVAGFLPLLKKLTK